jgi:hypothetical protein
LWDAIGCVADTVVAPGGRRIRPEQFSADARRERRYCRVFVDAAAIVGACATGR